jgi:hypothetical protein
MGSHALTRMSPVGELQQNWPGASAPAFRPATAACKPWNSAMRPVAATPTSTPTRPVLLPQHCSRTPASVARASDGPAFSADRAGLLPSCGGKLTTSIAPTQGLGYVCRRDENPLCPTPSPHRRGAGRGRVEGYVIDEWRNLPKPSISSSLTATEWPGSGRSPTRCVICRSRRTRRCG